MSVGMSGTSWEGPFQTWIGSGLGRLYGDDDGWSFIPGEPEPVPEVVLAAPVLERPAKPVHWRRTRETREWSLAVKARDGCCLDCGATERLHAHHLSRAASLRFDLANGRTLCVSCHRLRHLDLPEVLFAA